MKVVLARDNFHSSIVSLDPFVNSSVSQFAAHVKNLHALVGYVVIIS